MIEPISEPMMEQKTEPESMAHMKNELYKVIFNAAYNTETATVPSENREQGIALLKEMLKMKQGGDRDLRISDNRDEALLLISDAQAYCVEHGIDLGEKSEAFRNTILALFLGRLVSETSLRTFGSELKSETILKAVFDRAEQHPEKVLTGKSRTKTRNKAIEWIIANDNNMTDLYEVVSQAEHPDKFLKNILATRNHVIDTREVVKETGESHNIDTKPESIGSYLDSIDALRTCADVIINSELSEETAPTERKLAVLVTGLFINSQVINEIQSSFKRGSYDKTIVDFFNEVSTVRQRTDRIVKIKSSKIKAKQVAILIYRVLGEKFSIAQRLLNRTAIPKSLARHLRTLIPKEKRSLRAGQEIGGQIGRQVYRKPDLDGYDRNIDAPPGKNPGYQGAYGKWQSDD